MPRIKIYSLPEKNREEWQSELEGCSKILKKRILKDLLNIINQDRLYFIINLSTTLINYDKKE